jgi:hypothetical protein
MDDASKKINAHVRCCEIRREHLKQKRNCMNYCLSVQTISVELMEALLQNS